MTFLGISMGIDRMAELRMISPEAAASARRSRIEISPQAKNIGRVLILIPVIEKV